jgi:hypothetical protein
MYHEETPNWIPFLKAFGEIAIVKTPTILQAKLTQRGIPGIVLGPAEAHKIRFGIPSPKTFLNHVQQYSYSIHMLIFIR